MNRDAPSTHAASSRSAGTARNAARISQTASGSDVFRLRFDLFLVGLNLRLGSFFLCVDASFVGFLLRINLVSGTLGGIIHRFLLRVQLVLGRILALFDGVSFGIIATHQSQRSEQRN